jgi:hypothetical protein
MYEEKSLRIPNSPEYWIKKLGKRGKDVMIYTHDDLDGIISGIAIKKYFKDHGFNIIGYGLVSYQEGWKVITINPEVINVAVDFAEPHPDIDVYIDHHGDFVEGDKIAELARKKGAVKTKTGSAYEGIMDVLGLPVDSLVLSVIDMVDSAKYDEYGVKWTDLLDFDTAEIKKKPNAKLLFAGAFNQLLKRGEDATIIETIHNVEEPSIYKIFDYMRRLYPGNNPDLPRGSKPEDFSPEELADMGKDFVADSKGRIEQMKTRTRGRSEFKGVIKSQQEFKDKFTEHIEYGEKSRSKFAGQSADVIKLDGYVVIGEMAFLGSGTWANAIRARAIIQQDIESGRLPKEAEKIKWVLLQYGDTLQVCSYGNIPDYDVNDLPTSPTGKPVDDLKVLCVDLLEIIQKKLGFSNQETSAGGHKGIGSISNVGNATFNLPPDNKDYPYLGLRYIDILKNYMIGTLSKIKWELELSWENPFSPEYTEEPTPMNAKVMMINQIRRINNRTGEIELPDDYEKKPSLKQMRENEAKLKQLEKEMEEQRMKDHMALNDARHEYYRTHGEEDLSYEEWSKLSKEEQEKVEEERKLRKKSDKKTSRE